MECNHLPLSLCPSVLLGYLGRLYLLLLVYLESLGSPLRLSFCSGVKSSNDIVPSAPFSPVSPFKPCSPFSPLGSTKFKVWLGAIPVMEAEALVPPVTVPIDNVFDAPSSPLSPLSPLSPFGPGSPWSPLVLFLQGRL